MTTNGLFRWRGMFSKSEPETEQPQLPFVDQKILAAGIAPAPTAAVLDVRRKILGQLSKAEEHTRILEKEVAERQEQIRQNRVIAESLNAALTVLEHDCQVSKYEVDSVNLEPITMTEVLRIAEERTHG